MAKDLSKQGYPGFTDETVTVVQKMFDKYDLDRDCRLSNSEFRSVLVACGLREADAKAIYGKVDANHDGSVDMREFIKWLHAENPEMDADRVDVAKDRMAKVHKHMKRGAMNTQEALEDYFEFMAEMKEQYKFATKRDVVVLEKDLQDVTKKDGTSNKENSREVRLRDFFNQMDLNGNGVLTMSEFVRGVSSLGHTGNQEMVADIFRAIDTEKSKTRVWDRRYHHFKRLEDEAASQGKTQYLAPACEIFEKRDMRKWNEDRAEAINEEMRLQAEKMSEARSERKTAKKTKEKTEAKIKKMKDDIADKKVPNPEQDRQDYDDLRDAERELVALENQIARCSVTLHEPRFTFTTTTYKDGFLDWKEFQKAFAEWEKTAEPKPA
jgi:Ca2+-binding EF-hand superfamily protein